MQQDPKVTVETLQPTQALKYFLWQPHSMRLF